MKDFINPINEKDVQRIYNLLANDISSEQIKEYSDYIDFLMHIGEIKPKIVLINKIYDEHLIYVQNMFCDEYTKFYTLGQFQKMYYKAIYLFLDNKKSELDI